MSASVYLETFGCQMNVADSERAAVRLRAAGFDLADTPKKADVVIFNTCSVRERAAHKVFTRIGEVRRMRLGDEPVVGVMGCVAQLEGATLFDNSPSVNLIVGTRATDRLPRLIDRALEGERRVIDLGERAATEQWDVPATARTSAYVAFVPIIEGCNKFCTYCIVPFSRGREKSRSAADIINEVKELRAHGYREIHLIGQNVNSYRPKTESGLEGFKAPQLSVVCCERWPPREWNESNSPRLSLVIFIRTLWLRSRSTKIFAIGCISRRNPEAIEFCER